MDNRTLIVARMRPGSAERIAELFEESDAGALPKALGVRSRHLYSYHDLYFHHVEFEGDRGVALRTATGRPDFDDLCAALRSHIDPYDPATWNGPVDAIATEFYAWTPDGGTRR